MQMPALARALATLQRPKAGEEGRSVAGKPVEDGAGGDKASQLLEVLRHVVGHRSWAELVAEIDRVFTPGFRT